MDCKIQIQIQIILLHYNVLHSQTEFDPSYAACHICMDYETQIFCFCFFASNWKTVKLVLEIEYICKNLQIKKKTEKFKFVYGNI